LAANSQARLDEWELAIKPRRQAPRIYSISVVSVKNHTPDAKRTFTLRWLLRDISERKQIENDLGEIQDKLIESRERERQRIARQLHDGPIQDLYGVTFRLSSITNESNRTESLESLKQAQADLETVIFRLRDICSELRPPALIPFGLKQAIFSHAEQFEEKNPGLQVTVNAQMDSESLSEIERLAIFRIYQHLMANVARHAQASQVYIHFEVNDSELMMVIEDNGVGFDPPWRLIDLVRGRHFGLADADDRARHIGARLEITSKPGQGTHVRLIKKMTA
jgi:signal transduction histidine kinase